MPLGVVLRAQALISNDYNADALHISFHACCILAKINILTMQRGTTYCGMFDCMCIVQHMERVHGHIERVPRKMTSYTESTSGA